MTKAVKTIFIILVCSFCLIGKSNESRANWCDDLLGWSSFLDSFCHFGLEQTNTDDGSSSGSSTSESTTSCDNTISFNYLHCKTSADGDFSSDCETETEKLDKGAEVTIEWQCQTSCDTDKNDTAYYYINYTYSVDFDGVSSTITRDPHYLWADLSFTVPSDAPSSGTYYIKCVSMDGSDTQTKTINFKVKQGVSSIITGARPGLDITIPANTLTDADGDSYMSSDDCNDDDAAVHESATWYIDSDADGYGSTATTQEACSQPTGYASNSTDCNDAKADIFPGATEIDDDGIDQNCDGEDMSSTGDEDGDGILNGSDNCATTSNADQLDTDADGQGDACDTDDDNDGVLDTADAFPLDSTESVDSDADGIGDNADTDDDNDGVLDVSDAFPVDINESVDINLNGMGDNADTDDDSDTILDTMDNCPTISNTDQADADTDGIGDMCDAETGESATIPSSSGGCSCNLLNAQSSAPMAQNILTLLSLISLGSVGLLRFRKNL